MTIEVDFAMLDKILPYVTAVKKPVMIRGRHGIGKSEVVYQFAEKVGLPVVERRASQMTEGDLVGLPVKKGDSTAWNPPDWYKAACREPVVLFLDELDRATLEVRQGIFELADSRKINGHKLHPDTLIFAAVNGGKHGGSYQVGEQDPAEVDRWTIYDVEPSVEDWLDWGKSKDKNGSQNINSLVVEFIRGEPAFLEHRDEFDPSEVYPSRRSWKRCNDALEHGGMLEPGKSDSIMLNVAMGFIGHEAAIKLHDFVRTYERQVHWKDILDKGKFDLVEGFAINDHLGIVEKIIASKVLEKKLSKRRMENLFAYFTMIPSEIGMKLWLAMSSYPENTVELHKSEHNGITGAQLLVEFLHNSQKSEDSE